MGISSYSTTPGSNTSISGIDIGEGCNASNVNDAFRQLMADVKSALSTFALTYLDDADASATLTTLGLSTFIKTLIDDADASTALSTLGVSTFIKTVLDDTDAATARATLGLGSWATKVQTVSTSAPSGTPAAGDVWLVYTP